MVHSMFPEEAYPVCDLDAEEVQRLVDMAAALPQIHVWCGPNRSFSLGLWRNLCVEVSPAYRVVGTRAEVVGGIQPAQQYGMQYGVACAPVSDVDNEEKAVLMNLADIVALNRLPCVVKRSNPPVLEAGWFLRCAASFTTVHPGALRRDTVAHVEKMVTFTDHAGELHVRVLSKALPLHTLLQWQAEAAASRGADRDAAAAAAFIEEGETKL
jgi:hypothetical protein